MNRQVMADALQDWQAWSGRADAAIQARNPADARGYNDEAAAARRRYEDAKAEPDDYVAAQALAAGRAPVSAHDAEIARLVKRYGAYYAERIQREGAPVGICICGEPAWCGEARTIRYTDHKTKRARRGLAHDGCAPVGARSDDGVLESDGIWYLR